MSLHEQPLVSVVTPVYNGEDFLAECIESILAQTYPHFEYIIVNNCSTDRTLQIAKDYAQKDPRIRVHTNDAFVGVMENHNIALSLISPQAKYCKVVCADDFIFPECLAKMVELAEANPSAGLVGSYSIAGKQVIFTGLDYETKLVNGRELCRATLLGGPYVFGCPTSLLYRADLIRKTKTFFPSSSPHSDTTACYQSLEHSDFGFVHQVLSYTRIHAASESSKSLKYGTIRLSLLSDYCRFAPKYLSPSEVNLRMGSLVADYYHALVPTLFEQPGNKEFWQSQKKELQDIGLQFSVARLLMTGLLRGARLLFLKPGKAVKKLLARKRNAATIEAKYYEERPGTGGDSGSRVHV